MRPTGKMHSAKLEGSPRLRRLLSYLQMVGQAGATARDIRLNANVEAVSAAVDELRDNGVLIECKAEAQGVGRKQYVYRIVLAAPVQGDLFGEVG